MLQFIGPIIHIPRANFATQNSAHVGMATHPLKIFCTEYPPSPGLSSLELHTRFCYLKTGLVKEGHTINFVFNACHKVSWT